MTRLVVDGPVPWQRQILVAPQQRPHWSTSISTRPYLPRGCLAYFFNDQQARLVSYALALPGASVSAEHWSSLPTAKDAARAVANPTKEIGDSWRIPHKLQRTN
jgi:hypothetical protein